MQRIKFCHLIDTSARNPLLCDSVKFSNREKFDYTIATLDPSGELQEQMSKLGVNFYTASTGSTRNYLSEILKLTRFFAGEKFNIVQVHSFTASIVGLIAARLARVPIRIFTGHHSHEVPLHNNKKLTVVDGFFSRGLANRVLSPSEQMKEIFIQYESVPEERIKVIPHGMDLEAWRAKVDGKTNIKKELNIEDKIVFGAVGRLFWIKGLDKLIEAFSVIAERRKDIVLLIAGDGSDKEKLQNLINSLNMQERIFLIGRRKDIANVMSNFDVFVHPALAESFGQVFTEIFALGKPIISTKVGVANEIIKDGENGFLVNTGSAEELRMAMEKMLNQQSSWEEMGADGKRIAENFSVKTTQAMCDDYYISLMDS